MDLEGIMFSEISQAEKGTLPYHLHVESKNTDISSNMQMAPL